MIQSDKPSKKPFIYYCAIATIALLLAVYFAVSFALRNRAA